MTTQRRLTRWQGNKMTDEGSVKKSSLTLLVRRRYHELLLEVAANKAGNKFLDQKATWVMSTLIST